MSDAEALSPMALSRRILSSKTINGSDCIHDCHPSAFPCPPSLSSGESSSSSGRRVFSNAVLGGVSSAAAAAFLILTYYTVLVRRRRVGGRLPSAVNISASEADDADPDYPVWRIHTVGFDESTINSIVVKPYIAPADGGTADCSVCLLELREGDLVRLLSACAHAFHVPCIDTWLRAHISCPLCRASIVVPGDPVTPAGNALISDRSVSGDFEEDGGREMRTLAVADSILRARSDLLGNGLQSEWRSSSKNSSAGSDLFHSVDGDESFVEEEKKGQEHYCSDEDMVGEKRGKPGSSSKGDCPQKSPTEIGGGSSSGSRRMFFSRYGRARSSSFLPI